MFETWETVPASQKCAFPCSSCMQVRSPASLGLSNANVHAGRNFTTCNKHTTKSCLTVWQMQNPSQHKCTSVSLKWIACTVLMEDFDEINLHLWQHVYSTNVFLQLCSLHSKSQRRRLVSDLFGPSRALKNVWKVHHIVQEDVFHSGIWSFIHNISLSLCICLSTLIHQHIMILFCLCCSCCEKGIK